MNNPFVKTLEPVWTNTKDILVNEERLHDLIRGIVQKKERGELDIPAWAVPNASPSIDCRPAKWINYVCWINTVNFAFTNFRSPYEKFRIEHPEGVQWSGSFALGASFMRAMEDDVPILDAKYMSRITLKEVRYIFRPIDKNHRIPMIKERWEIFREVGKILIEKYDGSWLQLFVDGKWLAFDNGSGIVERLVADFPSFRDARLWQDCHGNLRHVWFNKRAQLLVMMYHGRAVNSGGRMPEIRDIADIGPIADYEVPKALRFLGVLEYSPAMEQKIQNRKVIMRGHPWEIENRLAMSYVMKRICDEAGINMAQADYYIWEMGRKSKDHHILVPTIDY